MTAPEPAALRAAQFDPRHLWQAYELAQKHYDSDLQLFSGRMNLFLLIQSALVAFAGTTARTGKVALVADRGAIASLGLALAIGWLLVAASSYIWIKIWRAHMMDLGEKLKEVTEVTVSSALFAHHRRREAHKRTRLPNFLEGFSWFVRPTLVTCCLPLVFIAGWIYLGWYA